MSDRTLSTAAPPLGRLLGRSLLIAGTITAAALAPVVIQHPDAFAAMLARAPHWPDVRPIAEASLAIKLHLATIAGAILVGGVLMSGVKGTRLHRTLGWTWASFIMLTAVSALFIRAPTGLPGIAGVGLLHIFSGITLVVAPLGVAAARRHQVERHARLMSGLFVGGLGVAGLFAFLPGRLLWQVLFG